MRPWLYCRSGGVFNKFGSIDRNAFQPVGSELAEQQGHHPDVLLAWGKVGISIWTHKIDGLTESDFILAAKIEKLL